MGFNVEKRRMAVKVLRPHRRHICSCASPHKEEEYQDNRFLVLFIIDPPKLDDHLTEMYQNIILTFRMVEKVERHL
jgi:hypothetical protein